MKRRVVVTGAGLITPLSCDVDESWKKILDCESGIHDIELFDTSDIKVKIGGDVCGWEYGETSAEARKIDRYSQFAMVAAADAVKASGLELDESGRVVFDSPKAASRFGVVLGSGIGGMTTIYDQMSRLIQKGPGRVSPMTIPKLMLNAGGGLLAIKYGLYGPNYSVATACASAANAIGNSIYLIRDNVCDQLITGGSEAAMTRMALAAFANMRALSTRNDDPEHASCPFDSKRDGFVFSEGAGIVVVEELETAKARGANILAEVAGFGTSCDAGHITSPDEEGRGAAQAMQAALDDAEIKAGDIDYINAHGTSTPLGDKAETRAIKTVFADSANTVAISSTKSQLGHSLGATGGIEMILCIKAIQEGIVPPTANLTDPDPDCDLDYTPLKPKERDITYAMSNSFGFGGHNASVIVKKYVE
ncbi:beta-ketoacyl-ACP synthase II [Mariniblastus fucicola]|uniref:3-oxoacyl-[acyl-carrier-protein] synthase 2 n=1 Tax=Mariniblastus fucicola TaxID=980251 RepID=A0A5B9PJ47_9BACT|nr:beta-ketoacyl-ACP synthase II [Mariniblastus fucicola]QEG24702.1 3-oxoacyl-[acyl-carrier-protein] synthase 2 [Mariniblastus fucicola]